MCRFNSHVVSNQSNVCSCSVSEQKSKWVYVLSTLPLKISIDIIMKSICETNASPKKKIKYAQGKRALSSAKNTEKRKEKETKWICRRWICMGKDDVIQSTSRSSHRIFKIYIFWCSVDARTRNCSLKTSYIMAYIQPKSTHAQRLIFLFSFHLFSQFNLRTFCITTTVTVTLAAASKSTKQKWW